MTASKNSSNPTSSKVVLEVDAFPFKGLKISDDWKKLESVEGRTLCSVCKKSRKYFCYTCYVPVSEIKHILPKVKLPIKIDIVKHAREMDGKSTAVHAAVLAPEDVRIFTYPCIPDYGPEENVVLIFPNKDAVSVEEVCDRFFSKVNEPVPKRQCTETSRFIVHRAVFIDSTWNQSRGIFKDPRIKALSSVVLRSRLSQFWRHQTNSPRWYLATIEAIHQFLVELDAAQWHLNCRTATLNIGVISENSTQRLNEDSEGFEKKNSIANSLHDTSGQDRNTLAADKTNVKEVVLEHKEYSYNGQYDNLLFFFRFMYSKIHMLYDHEQLRSYKRRLE